MNENVLNRTESQLSTQIPNYNDTPVLDENLLNEMAKAYDIVMQNQAANLQQENSLNNLRRQLNQPQPTSNIPANVEPPNPLSLATTNQLLTEILAELKTIICIMDRQHRHRMS